MSKITNGMWIAAAIAIVGGAWLYLTEIRPAQLREECTADMVVRMPDNTPTIELQRVVKFCVDGGGWDNLVDQTAARRETLDDPAEATNEAVGAATEVGE